MAEPILVADIDGTLATRGRPLGPTLVRLLSKLESAGWRVALLTGQPFSNVRARLRITSVAPDLTIYTCEGARRWTLRGGKFFFDRAYASSFSISSAVRRQVSRIFSRSFIHSISVDGLRVVNGPEWWEGALFAFRVSGNLEGRLRLVQAIRSILSEVFLSTRSSPSFRVGIAGKTTVVVGIEEATKARVLTELIAKKDHSTVVFLADEFTPPGNDSSALFVNGLLRVGVSRKSEGLGDLVALVGPGPRAARQFLRELALETQNWVADPQVAVKAAAETCR